MTRMCWMSVRLGIRPALAKWIFLRLPRYAAVCAGRSRLKRVRRSCPPPLQQFDETVEEVGGIVRSGRCLRVVLHAERSGVLRAQPFDDVVVQADVADLDRAELGAGAAVERRVHGKAV